MGDSLLVVTIDRTPGVDLTPGQGESSPPALEEFVVTEENWLWAGQGL